MQLAHCTVKLGGSPLHTVRRINVSVPEVMVLRAIHGGGDAVDDFKFAGNRPATDEKEELKKIYGGKDEISALIDKLFPGARPSMPTTFAEIDIVVDETEPAVEAEPVKEVDGQPILPPKAVKKEAVLG